MTILVTGVRGKTGRQVADVLARRAQSSIKGAGRNPSEIRQPGVTAVLFDWDDPGTWGNAVAGVDAVYIVKPRDPNAANTVGALLQEMRGVQRVVLLSEIDAGDRDASAVEREVERVVEQSAFDWTILRPNWFMQNFSEPGYYLGDIRDKGELALPTGGSATSVVDTRDIAEVAANCLTDSNHAGRSYTLTGPDALTWSDMARTLAAAAGHEVRHVDVSLETFLQASADSGTSAARVDYYRRVYSAIVGRRTAPVSSDVNEVTGRPPRSFRSFVEENAPVWRR